MKPFDYYIFIDYSVDLLGYTIIENNKIKVLLPKITKLKHYKKVRHKRQYLNAVKKIIDKQKIKSDLFRFKIKHIKQNLEIYTDVAEFLKKNKRCIIFISVDNNQYVIFKRLVNVIDGATKVVKESDLKKWFIGVRIYIKFKTALVHFKLHL